MTLTAWTVLLALGIVLAGLGYEYERRPVYADPAHWSNAVAYAVKVIGRMLVFLAVALFCVGDRAVQGGLSF
ncbi:MAG: hypothetical protein J0H34_23820 [Rhizobiales bacterium]|nr:hypothetical protein [Hyphomicrobiales bacterium]